MLWFLLLLHVPYYFDQTPQLLFFTACFSVAIIWGQRLFYWESAAVIQWRLLDAFSGNHSLSVLLSAMETCHATQIAPALAWWPSSEIIHTHVRVPCILAAATILRQHLFGSKLPITWLLFKGSIYSKKYSIFLFVLSSFKFLLLLKSSCWIWGIVSVTECLHNAFEIKSQWMLVTCIHSIWLVF